MRRVNQGGARHREWDPALDCACNGQSDNCSAARPGPAIPQANAERGRLSHSTCKPVAALCQHELLRQESGNGVGPGSSHSRPRKVSRSRHGVPSSWMAVQVVPFWEASRCNHVCVLVRRRAASRRCHDRPTHESRLWAYPLPFIQQVPVFHLQSGAYQAAEERCMGC